MLHSAPHGDDSDTDPWVLYGGLTEKQLRRAQRVQSRMENEKSLGAVLLELGEITSDDFERVQAIRRANLSLIEILHDDGHVTDEGVASYREPKLANPGADDRVLLVDAGRVNEEEHLRALAATDSVSFTSPVADDIDRTLQEDGFLKATLKMTSVSELVGHVPRDLNARPLADLRETAGLKREADPAPGTGQRSLSDPRSTAGLRSPV